MKSLLYLSLIFCLSCNVTKKVVKSPENGSTISSETDLKYSQLFIDGTKFKLLNNSQQAIKRFYSCIELKPSHPAPYFQLSDIYSAMGDYTNALAFSRKTVSFDPNNKWYLLQLAELYQKVKKIDSAALIYTKLVKLVPSEYSYQYNLSLLYIQLNKLNKSVDVLLNLKRKFGPDNNIIITLYKIYSYERNYKQCLSILFEGLIQNPDNIQFLGLIAETYLSLEDFENALKYYNKLLDLDPQSEKGILSLINFYRITKDYSSLHNLALKYLSDSTMHYANKIDIISGLINDNNFISKVPDSLYNYIQVLDTLYPSDFKVQTLYIDYYLKLRKLTQARDKLIDLVETYKTTYAFWEQLIYVLSASNDFDRLKDYCNKGIELFPDKPLFYLYNGIASFTNKHYTEAISLLNKGLNIATSDKNFQVRFYTYLGESYNAIKEFKTSDSYFQKALALDPNNVFILNNYSFYLAERNENLDMALNYIKVCLKLHPDSYSYLDTYGWILYKRGNISQAKKTIKSSIEKGGINDKEILEHYVFILNRSGDTKEAVNYYKLLMKIGEPSNEVKSLFYDSTN